MVVIEPIKTTPPVQESTEEKSSTATTDESLDGTGNTVASATSGNDSDGYETASETELNDADREPEINNNNTVCDRDNSDGDARRGAKEEEERKEESESVDNELNEKAFAQANDEKLEGNSLFKSALYEEALSKYELAIQVAPDGPSSAEIRSICHANRAACFSKLSSDVCDTLFLIKHLTILIDNKHVTLYACGAVVLDDNHLKLVGKFEETIKECTKAIELNSTYIKALLRRAEAREKLEQYEEAIADTTKILELDQSNDQARRTIIRLKPLADEKREKMKEEMIGKLKEMGNSILGRFGMSTDNFKAVKDPNTGSYSISFQR